MCRYMCMIRNAEELKLYSYRSQGLAYSSKRTAQGGRNSP